MVLIKRHRHNTELRHAQKILAQLGPSLSTPTYIDLLLIDRCPS